MMSREGNGERRAHTHTQRERKLLIKKKGGEGVLHCVNPPYLVVRDERPVGGVEAAAEAVVLHGEGRHRRHGRRAAQGQAEPRTEHLQLVEHARPRLAIRR